MPLSATIAPTLQTAFTSPMLANAVRVPQYAYSRKEQDEDGQPIGSLRTRKQTAPEQDYLDDLLQKSAELVSPVLSSVGYLGSSVIDAIAGRRTRAGLAILTGQAKDKDRWSELFLSLPVVSDLLGTTDRNTQVTGSDLLGGWDDPDTILDGVAEFAVEMLTDPLTYTPGVLLGAFGKAGRIAQVAGMMPKVAKAMSKQAGRRVGVREASAMAGLKKAVVLSNRGNTDLTQMSAKLRKVWDDAAAREGYGNIDEAMKDLEGGTLGGRIGLTWNPFGQANKVYGTGELARKQLRAIDTAADYLGKSAVGVTAAKWFNPAVRGAGTAEVQGRLNEVAPQIERMQQTKRLKAGQRHYKLTAAGLDDPKYREAMRGMVERSVRKLGKPSEENQWLLASSERDIDQIISNNLKHSGFADYREPKKHPAYAQIREYLDGVWSDTADNLIKFHDLGLGNKELDDLWNSYMHRSTGGIDDPKYYKRKPPTHITQNMRRILKDKHGMADDDIDKLAPEDALQKAMGTRITEADKYRAEQIKAGKGSVGGGLEQRVAQTSDQTQIRRQEYLKGIRGGGTSWLNHASMDTRISGPLSDYADDLSHRTKIVYEEGMQGKTDALRKADDEARRRFMDDAADAEQLGTERTTSEFSPFHEDQTWGDLADLDGIDFARGKKATDLLGSDARRLNDWLNIERGAYDQSQKIADWLGGLDPRHAAHQRPLFKNDPGLDHMDFELASGRTLLMAKGALKAAADGIDSNLTHHTQGKTVIRALRGARFSGKGMTALKAFFDHNLMEGGQDAVLKKAMKTDKKLLFEENPHARFLEDGGNVAIDTRTAHNEINPKWLAHELNVAQAKLRYGLKPPSKYSTGKTSAIYKALKKQAQFQVDAAAKDLPYGGGVHLRPKDLRELARKAQAMSTKLKPETLATIINDIAYQNWVKNGGKPFRVRLDVANDLRKVMDLTADSEAVRGFTRIWDKMTDTWKGSVTSQFIGYHARNLQNLGLMDFIFGEGSEGGLTAMFSPKRVKRFAQSWRMSKQLHAGETIKGVSDTPYFKGTDWREIAARTGDEFNGTGDVVVHHASPSHINGDFRMNSPGFLGDANGAYFSNSPQEAMRATGKNNVKLSQWVWRPKSSLDVSVGDNMAIYDRANKDALRKTENEFSKYNASKAGKKGGFSMPSQVEDYHDVAKALGIKTPGEHLSDILLERGYDAVEGIGPYGDKIALKPSVVSRWKKPSASSISPDELATKYLRLLAMASDTTPKHATGEFAETVGRNPQSVSGVAEMIPGQGKNIESLASVWGDAKSTAGRIVRDIRDNGWKADLSFLNPLQIRGGFFGKSNVGDGSQFALQRAGEKIGGLTEDVGRTATWLRMVLNKSETPMHAAAKTNAMHVDFRQLTNFEKRVMRRAVPFYTYTRKMTEYFLRDLMQHPGGRTANMVRAINNSTGEGRGGQDSLTPPQLAGQMAIPLYRKGNNQAFLRPDLPPEVLNDMFSIGPDAYSTFQNTVLGWLGQLHVIPKATMETAFGRSAFQKGRNLEELYSRIGTKDPILNQIVSALPISRYISTFGPRGTLFDERKTAAEKFSSIVLGTPISTIDMEKAANEAVSSAISRELRTEEGVSRAERYYAYDEEQVSERGKELLELQNSLSKRRTAMRKKLKKDAERDAERSNPSGNMPFDRLMGR